MTAASHPAPVVSRSDRPARSLYPIAVFASAAMMFLVEPMIGRLVLPTLGGTPAVWNTSLAFFQAALLVGYAYAHLLQRLASVRRQAIVHGIVLVAACTVLPLRVSGALGPPGSLPPALWLVSVLTLSFGPPFAALSATAPLVQAWYARLKAGGGSNANPYALYAASNLGSLLALLAYPVMVEPLLRLKTQTVGWSLGYVAFVVLMAAVARFSWRAPPDDPASRTPSPGAKPAWAERLVWVLLGAAPSSLMLGVTSHIATDIASAPFLWVAPLALYLLSFVIAFQDRPPISTRATLDLQAATMVIVCFLFLGLGISSPLPASLLGNLSAFFLTALVCNRALAARRPANPRLTEFFLFMSIGGVVGGGFNAFAAPLIFHTVTEYPLVLIAASLARPWGSPRLSTAGIAWLVAGLAGAAAAALLNTTGGITLVSGAALAITMVAALVLRHRALAFVALCAALSFSAHQLENVPGVLKSERGFFGVLKYARMADPPVGEVRMLLNGTTVHGVQAEDPKLRCRPMAYYASTTPIGQAFTTMQASRAAMRIGAVGMGAGTVAAYVRPADSLRFFEINPQVVAMATDPALFSYIHGCARGHVDWVLGDARLTLAHEPRDTFDLLLVDAFSSDSVPTHLLTVEAMRSYLAHIKPDGVVLMHLTNRHLELMAPVAAVARAAGGATLQQTYSPTLRGIDASESLIVVARSPSALALFRRDPRWTPAPDHGVRAWTDDYSNVFGAVVRKLERR